MIIFVFDRVEIIVGTGENASYQHFLLFSHCFKKHSISGLLKIRIVWLRINMHVTTVAHAVQVKIRVH